MMTPDVNIILLNLPVKEKEAVTENEDGSFTIIINSRLSNDEQFKAYRHAMRHIENDDFQKDNVQTIETIAHEVVIPVESRRIPSDRFLQRLKKIRAERQRLQQKLRQYEEEIEVIRGAEGYKSWDVSDQQLSDRQQWYGSNL